ncbi:hypothetical protein B0H13DRAFT_1592773 [Mycena leptocephala]|nr:hypothetical protein B0H13DRAFT_1592773 [Mycena leptocephala]
MSGTTTTDFNNGHEALNPSDSEVTPNTAPEIPPVSSYSRSGQSQFSSASSSTPPEKSRATDSPNLNKPIPPKPAARTDSSETFETFEGVSLEDPTWKVLPAALKEYGINNDHWENYVIFISYDSTGERIERCLSYDEKPLLIFQKFKDAKKNPVFMLKHIKDIRSPIAVAQQKHAARKASSIPLTSMSTAVTKSNSGREALKPSESEVTPNTAPEMPPVSSDSLVSYAVAVYPWMAEQEDEFDVDVNDMFIIRSRARGWWVVQRDPTGSGILDTDLDEQKWVPAGCLLATNVPVASAIATAAKSSSSGSSSGNSPPKTSVSTMPILPLSIISTSFLGIVLTDYKKKGEGELDLLKDEALRVYKRYNHWAYVVTKEGGDRGWVPCWLIGKVATGPATPSTSVPPPLTSSIMDDSSQV